MITLDPFTNKHILKIKCHKLSFVGSLPIPQVYETLTPCCIICPFEHPTLECLNKEFFFSILKSVQVSVLVFNNQPMLVLESIVSYKMCIVTSRDDSSSIQCFLFTLVFAPCIILALKYGKVLIQTDKISGTAFHGIKSFPKLLNFYILTEKSICVTAHCLLFHMSLFSMARKILILFCCFGLYHQSINSITL